MNVYDIIAAAAVVLILAAAVALAAARRKKGGSCHGDCASCAGCDAFRKGGVENNSENSRSGK